MGLKGNWGGASMWTGREARFSKRRRRHSWDGWWFDRSKWARCQVVLRHTRRLYIYLAVRQCSLIPTLSVCVHIFRTRQSRDGLPTTAPMMTSNEPTTEMPHPPCRRYTVLYDKIHQRLSRCTLYFRYANAIHDGVCHYTSAQNNPDEDSNRTPSPIGRLRWRMPKRHATWIKVN